MYFKRSTNTTYYSYCSSRLIKQNQLICVIFLQNKSILGSLLGRRSCQRLNANREYIVFIEPFFDGTYRPVDFEEVPYSNQINSVLEKTCGLSRTYPFMEVNDTEAILTSKCPSAVSIDCQLGTLYFICFHVIHFIFIETSKTTVASSTTTTNSVLTTTISSIVFEKGSIDFEALSLLLAEHQQENLTLAFSQGQNHKSLFSDDDARKSKANRLSFILTIHFMFFSILYIIF